MAELGCIAAVFQVADIGVRLGVKLFNFGHAVSGADDSISFISKDVSHTSCILKELAQSLGKALEIGLCSENAYRTANSLVNECRAIFEEMDRILTKKARRMGLDGTETTAARTVRERWKWPFLQPKMKLLWGNLSKLTSTLHLMLNVMFYASQVVARTEPLLNIRDQQTFIDDLIRMNEEQSRKYKALEARTAVLQQRIIEQVVTVDEQHSYVGKLPSQQPLRHQQQWTSRRASDEQLVDHVQPENRSWSASKAPANTRPLKLSHALSRYLDDEEKPVPQFSIDLASPLPSNPYTSASVIPIDFEPSGTSMLLSAQSLNDESDFDDLPAMTESSASDSDLEYLTEEPISKYQLPSLSNSPAGTINSEAPSRGPILPAQRPTSVAPSRPKGTYGAARSMRKV